MADFNFTSPLQIPSLKALKDLITTPFGAHNAIGDGTHYAIDLSAKEGTPIYAPASGVVVKSYSEAAGGNVLVIQHDNGVQTIYAHAKNYVVGVKDTVADGQVIGYVGKTGKVTGPHLHFGATLNGNPINPLNLFDGTGISVPNVPVKENGIKIPVVSETLGGIEAVGAFFGSLGEFFFNGGLIKFLTTLLAFLAGTLLIFVGGRMVWSAV